MHRLFIFFVVIITSVYLVSCDYGLQNLNNQTNDLREFPVKYAEFFKIFKSDSIYILSIINPWKPEEEMQRFLISTGKDITGAIKIPVNSVSVHSLDYIGFIQELDEISAISSITDANRVYNAQIQSLLGQKLISDLGPATELNIELLLQTKPDLIFTTTYESDKKGEDILQKAQIPTIYNMGWMEKSPLGRAEWIKVIGLMFNKIDLADSVFSQIEKNYKDAKEFVEHIKVRPRVMVGGDYNGVWYTPGGKSFKAKLIEDAGAEYFWSSNTTTGSIPLSFEKVLSVHFDDDIWIECPYKDSEELKLHDKRLIRFKSVRTGNVYNNLKSTNGLANDYWETGICRPDWILMDILTIFYPAKYNHGLKYYNKLN